MSLPIVNENFIFGCVDSARQSVDLSACLSTCFTLTKSATNKVDNSSVIQMVQINVTTATGTIVTTAIDGSKVTFVSASGIITGNSEKYKADGLSVCLADKDIQGSLIDSYNGKGTIGELIVVGTNVNSGATVTDVCKLWFKDAGQKIVLAE